jgi:GntR family histidine utilization transcriptional repressor
MTKIRATKIRATKIRVTKTKPEPLYQQVKRYILDKVDAGDWVPAQRIPSENELVRELGASRMTVNRALRELANAGRIDRMQGVGTFVADPRPSLELLQIRNIADEIHERGHKYGCTIIEAGAVAASDEVADALVVPPGSEVFHSVLIHREDDVAIQLEDRYVNPEVAPDYLSVDFAQTTPNEYLMRQAPLSEVEHALEAVLPSKRIQALLAIGPDEPCLQLHRRTWSRGHVASRAWLTHPGSRYRISARFTHAERQ